MLSRPCIQQDAEIVQPVFVGHERKILFRKLESKLLCRGVSPAFCLLRCPVCLLAKACLLRRCSASWIREVFVLLATSVRCGARSGVDLRTRFSREGSSPGLCLLAPSSGCTRGLPTAEPPDITPLLSLFQESFSSFLPERHPSPVSVPHPCGQCDRREITPSVDKESGLRGDERTNAGPCEKSNLSMVSKTDTSAHTSRKGKFAHTSFPIGKGDREQFHRSSVQSSALSAVQGSQ